MRCDTAETSGHVTAKSSIYAWAVFYKSGTYVMKVQCLTLGGLLGVDGTTEIEAIQFDRLTEISRWHSRCKLFALKA